MWESTTPEPITRYVSDARSLPILASNTAAPAPAGCITKKWLFFVLRPTSAVYRATVVRDFFSAADRLARCGISPEQFPHIRVFSPEATCVIVADLRQLNFIS